MPHACAMFLLGLICGFVLKKILYDVNKVLKD